MNKIGIHFSQVSEGMTLIDQDEIKRVVEIIRLVRERRGTVYLFGNGGSHATASHFANDMMKQCLVRAACVGDMVPSMTAWGNDTGWDNMYRGPLSKILAENDGVIGISCGGNSMNVVRALSYALGIHALSAGLTGMSSESEINKLKLDALVHTPVPDIRVQEDLHMMICHAIVRALQEE